MAVIRLAPATFNTLISRVRADIDPSTDPRTSASIPAANRRWADSRIIDAINDVMVRMGNHMAGSDPGESVLASTMTYTDDSGFCDLPAAIQMRPIYKVEDYRDANNPLDLLYVSPLEAGLSAFDNYSGVQRYTLVASSLASSTTAATHLHHRIGLRPRPYSTVTLRIFFSQTPLIWSDSSDGATTTWPLDPRWMECCWRNAQLDLLAPDNEASAQQIRLAENAWAAFMDFSKQKIGPERVRSRRRMR